ncbi:PREDICTED: G-type lectin S-receptor-like serine/threonine-protein kinase At4g27290 [Prunus mume]|uniref:G-type lectin S-receptor-like serine/threonine-protein kinase At4g27290 n=1 Tax=Prunus mume TaxID=102107 RepID=A0ABM1LYZ2_PRUMU|nr:PREDICTED: G-type lectin S-receptor-like serine/threonine-protein kinase At4g27290 [Prunus mume]
MQAMKCLFVCSFLFSFLCISTTTATDTITPSRSMRDGETLVSAGGSFQLGFFRPGTSKGRYLGIWYSVHTETVVWVANRERPLGDSSGVLKVTEQGVLVLLNSTNRIVWSSNSSTTAGNPVSQLMDSGNFVLKDGNETNPDKFLWQSFDYPCDTFLPEMKLGWDLVTGLERYLSSWRSTDDPAPGEFSSRMDRHGFPQVVTMKGAKIMSRPGSWNGLHFTGYPYHPQTQSNPALEYEIVLNKDEAYYEYKLLNTSMFSRYVLNPSGTAQKFTWVYQTHSWELSSAVQADQCQNYALCGAYTDLLVISGVRSIDCTKDYLGEDREDMELTPLFDLSTVAKATNDFSSSNKLGEGGFGPVYKGILIGGKEIAVKRLSKNSGQGIIEFKNEVILIARLQHRNLVKLLGCCVQEDEKILIYEFMPNKSLDFFIFDQEGQKLLNWPTCFHIIGGIARGLVYLHQDSRLRIIHRDLKASNILLDNDMNPKIADFGLAKTFGSDQSRGNTKRVVGTYGYMSPEYAVDGIFSMKSDVFSFGVILLEILSRKKNRGFSHPDHHLNLLGHAWTLWIQDKQLELIDTMLYDSCNISEVLRCLHVGLLCVQRVPEDRPNMSYVVLMLSSDITLPPPRQPGFYTERSVPESPSRKRPFSVNYFSTTVIEAR